MRRFVFCLLLFALIGCQKTAQKDSSPFSVTGFWSSNQIEQKKLVDRGTGVIAVSIPLKGKIDLDQDYTIGPGDKLHILSQSQEELTGEYTVNEIGYIRFPLIGLFKVQGLTLAGIQDALQEALKRYIRRPILVVDLVESENKQVYVYGALGEFGPYKQMGIYKLNKPTKILALLASLGGPKPDADIRNISVSHSNGSRDIIDLNRILIQGDQSQNILLKPGDIVYIPSSATGENKVVVLGAVEQPGLYSFESEISALQAVALAKSFTKRARVEDAFVIRTNVKNPYLLRVNFKRILTKGESLRDVALQKGDIVFVPDNAVTNYNRYLERIRPTLNILRDITGLILDADAVSVAFDRGFGEAPEIETSSETDAAAAEAAALQSSIDRAVERSLRSRTVSSTE